MKNIASFILLLAVVALSLQTGCNSARALPQLQPGDTLLFTIDKEYLDSLPLTAGNAELFNARFEFNDTLSVEPECVNPHRMSFSRHYLLDSIVVFPNEKIAYLIGSLPAMAIDIDCATVSIAIADPNQSSISPTVVAYLGGSSEYQCSKEARIRFLADGYYYTTRTTCFLAGPSFPNGPENRHCTSEARIEF
jgi:hypothetical protein